MRKKLLLLTPFLLFAMNNEVKDIRFEGLEHLSQVSAKGVSLLQKGEELDLDKVNKTIKKFYEYGYFKDIEADFTDDGILVYKFKEKPAILKIKYKRVSEDLKTLLKDKIKKGMIFSQEKLDEIRDFIVSYYDAKGRFNTVVIFDKQKVGNGLIITIRVNKGENTIINKLKFYGVQKEDVDDIKWDMKNVDRDVLGWLPFRNNGELSLQGLLTDSGVIKDFYLRKGYLDVNVSKPLLIANFDNNKASLEYKVEEGNRYKIDNVKVEIFGDKNVINIPKIKEKFLTIKGLFFNVDRLRKDISLLKRAVADKGYAYCEIYPDIQKNGDKVSVIYKIITHQKVYISDVVIGGNSKTLDRVIRRNIYLKPGYLYSWTDKEDSINALKRSGYFDDVSFKEVKIDDSHIKILVNVKEGLTGSLKGGISYNSYSQFGVTLSVSEKNIFGSGDNLGITLEKTGKSTSYNFSLTNPSVNDGKYSLSTNVYKRKYTGYSYDSKTTGFSIGSGRGITRHSRVNLGYGYENLHLSNVTDLSEYYKPDSIKSYISPSIVFNNTDDHFFPQHGMVLSASLLYAGIGGTQRFLKNKESAKFYYSLEDKFDITTILKYKITYGYLKEIGYTPLNERFYLGGLGTVRGYDYGSISPKDSAGNSIGGNHKLINSAEISIPLSLKRKMWLSGFLENGRTGDNGLTISRSSYGISFDWITPIGPLDFTYAWAIDPQKGDDLRRFEFSIGTGF